MKRMGSFGPKLRRPCLAGRGVTVGAIEALGRASPLYEPQTASPSYGAGSVIVNRISEV
jgi:hypothetical protein